VSPAKLSTSISLSELSLIDTRFDLAHRDPLVLSAMEGDHAVFEDQAAPGGADTAIHKPEAASLAAADAADCWPYTSSAAAMATRANP
jgi:hypothetical protein